jgi:phage-related protein
LVIVDIEPVTGFLNSLEPTVRAKAYRGIDLLAKNWPAIGEPYVERLPDELCVLRERYSNVQIRLFFFQVEPGQLAMVDGYIKKTRKIPLHVLKRAVLTMKIYMKSQK